MAEVKNAFIKSKMNLDLDARLVPQGEYRQGFNIQVSKSEGDDVGALENVLGNENLQNFKSLHTGQELQVIGYVANPINNSFYFFLTDYTDPGFPTESNYSVNAHNYIYSYNALDDSFSLLVQGQFLNFSTTNPIYGINIVENLLFWTDNRNQPRKINITYDPSYYTNEDHISVAKFAPYEAINLYKESSVSGQYESTLQDVVSPLLPDGVTNNPYKQNNYPGDPNFLEDKFVRFSYRFKFDDNEYSALAPFTQECFIPKQDGYFMNGDQESAYRSTVVEFMENKVNKIILNIPLPFNLEGTQITGTSLRNDLKVTEIDIIYKESDNLSVQVVDTILETDFNSLSTGFVSYTYQGTKPYKTLPENELVRVYDKVPVKAFSQEASGNRIIYGNFQNKHTPPAQLDYKVGAFDKSSWLLNANNSTENATSKIEYPNSTIKQNRNYQVGVVLSDRYGRSSTVLLASPSDIAGTDGTQTFLDSTYYNPYRLNTDTPVTSWPGEALKILFESPIESIKNEVLGTPGLFNGTISDSAYNILGWHNYKIVVKQFEQEYYNVYLPGALNAYPGGTSPDGDGANDTAFIVLINDNINKVPRDLSEVGPEQKQYRSSVQLFGRVTPDAAGPPTFNKPFFPGSVSSTVNTIAEQNFILGTTSNDYEDIYQTKSNPYLARITQSIGTNGDYMGSAAFTTSPANYQLAVYETDPDVSRLDIYYESSSSGLISQLNNAINTGTNNVLDLNNDTITGFTEASPIGTPVTAEWAPTTTNSLGEPFNGASTVAITRVINANGQVFTPSEYFAIETVPATTSPYNPTEPTSYDRYFIKTAKEFYYGLDAEINQKYFVDVSITPSGAATTTKEFILPLQNQPPTITKIELSNGAFIEPLANPYTLQKAAGDTGTLATFYGKNGTIISNLQSENLTWSIIEPQDQTIFQINDSGVLSTQQDLSGPYSLTIRVTDAGGLTADTVINAVFGETSINPGFGEGLGISMSGQGGMSGALYFVNNLTNAAGSTPLPGVPNTSNNDIRSPYPELQLGTNAPATTVSANYLVDTCTPFTMYNTNTNAFKFAPTNQGLIQSDGGLSQGTAFIAININFNQLPFDLVNQDNYFPFLTYPIYLQYRTFGGGDTWATAIDIEGKEIKFGGSQENRKSPLFPDEDFNNDIKGKGVIHSEASAEYQFDAFEVNNYPLGFGGAINKFDCLQVASFAKSTSASPDQNTMARKVFAFGKTPNAGAGILDKFGDYRLIVRYPWGLNTYTGISNAEPIVVGHGANNCPDSAFSSYLGPMTATVDFGDFYYPSKYGGANLYSYEYRISPTHGNTATLASALVPSQQVFAREWHMKYITQLYKDAELTQKWSPSTNGDGIGWYCYMPSNDGNSVNAKYGTDYSNTSQNTSPPSGVSPATSRKWVAFFNGTGYKDTTVGSDANFF
jgi:hypothetical protein